MSTALFHPSADDLLDPWLDGRCKGWPLTQAPLRRSQVGTQGWNLLAGDLPLPLAVVRQTRLQHNLGWMQRFASDRGLVLAPHGKTTMSPQLFQQQMGAGAWGLTVASVGQAAVAAAAGAQHILIANQVVGAAELAGLQRLQAQHAGLQLLSLVDSLAQLALIEATTPARPLALLLELGLPGGRTGCRSHDEALALARAVHASPATRLVGIECYEGLEASGVDAQDSAYVQSLMQRMQALAQACDAEALFEPEAAEPVLVSAGGSGLFDFVAEQLKPALSRPVLGVLRSGCYLTHDHGRYQRLVAQVNRRLGCSDSQGLQGALEVWATVQSVPEPGLALLTAGRRDVSYDIEMPLPLWWCPAGDTRPQPAPAGWRIKGLNDQHAHLVCDGTEPTVGDRVGLGISHPCTTFDKWRWMAIVDDHYRVIDALVTWF